MGIIDAASFLLLALAGGLLILGQRRAVLGVATLALLVSLGAIAMLHWQAIAAAFVAVLLTAWSALLARRYSSSRRARLIAGGLIAVAIVAATSPYFLFPLFS